LVAADGYHYGGRQHPRLEQLTEIAGRLPSVERVVLVDVLGSQPPALDGLVRYQDFLAAHRGAPPRYERLPFDHPLYVLYSSGTTGKPKCMVHRAGGILVKHLQEQRHHCDLSA